ncbi:MAG: tRNA dihydrouridine synthase DusB, partial [Desulfobulbaceae bacterium]|nr:tRNA dihydrouridine synthase DusB [Candidatus Desulfobia pelagia]
RLLCKEYGAGLVYSEMISCHGLIYRQQKTIDMLQTVPEERPIAIQLFGSEPDIMGEAAAFLADMPIDFIDINMGCPVKKVTKKGAGSALMKTPELAAEIIRQVLDNGKKPVTVKIRSGWTHKTINAPEFAKMAEDNGAAALAIHGRTWSDGFSGKADWQVISAVKQSVSIPVIGNGDITCYAEGRKMMAETGCDGVMIGRAAMGKPWIFRPDNPEPDLKFRLSALKRHLELIAAHRPVELGLADIRNHAGRYFKGIAHSSAIRQQIYEASSFQNLRDLLLSLTTDIKP